MEDQDKEYSTVRSDDFKTQSIKKVKPQISKKIQIIRKQTKFTEFSESPVYKDAKKLLPYQVTGVNWLINNWRKKSNSFLADEMGLGKTIQSIAFIESIHDLFGVPGPFLIVCPLSTVSNWSSELEQWSNMRHLVIAGSRQQRSEQIEQFISSSAEYIITTYETLIIENTFFNKTEWSVAIFDEAHRLRNHQTLVYRTCFELPVDHNILLSGTPLQNNLTELWSLLHFIDPKRFSLLDEFLKSFSDVEDPETLQKLQALLSECILRRNKSDYFADAEKVEIIVDVEITQLQRTLYKSVIDDNRDILLQNLSRTMVNLNNITMELRKICNHPYLIPGIEDLAFTAYLHGNSLPLDTPHSLQLDIEAMIYASGKLILIDKLLPKLKENGHKVLIFSQMSKVLDILEDYLAFKGFEYERLDGSTNLQVRSESIDRFTRESSSFVFLLSTRAGGQGINLTSADTVILYDSDWNPQNDIQAQSRVHRIGQTKRVTVYRLVSKNTYESEMFQRIAKKLSLNKALFQTQTDASTHHDSPTVKEVEDMVKKGAYHVFNDESNEIQQFIEEDIEQILEKRTRKVTFKTPKIEVPDSQSDEFWSTLLKEESSFSLSKRRRKKVRYEDSQPTGDDEDAREQNSEEEKDEDFKTEVDPEVDRIEDAFLDSPSTSKQLKSPTQTRLETYRIPYPILPGKQSLTLTKSDSNDPLSTQSNKDISIDPMNSKQTKQINTLRTLVKMLKTYGLFQAEVIYVPKFGDLRRAFTAIIWGAYKICDEEIRNMCTPYIKSILQVSNLTLSTSFSLEAHPFDDIENVRQLFDGQQNNFLLSCRQQDRYFMAASYLRDTSQDGIYSFAASCCSLESWTILNDYRLLLNLVVDGQGQFEAALLRSLPKSATYGRINVALMAQRLEILVNEILFVMPSDYAISITPLTLQSPPSHLLGETDYITREQKKRVILYLALHGIPVNSIDLKLIHSIKESAGLPNVTDLAIRDFIFSLIKMQESWIPQDVYKQFQSFVTLLIDLRKMYNSNEVPEPLPKWEIAPSWWGRICDEIFIAVISKYGFLSFPSLIEKLIDTSSKHPFTNSHDAKMFKIKLTSEPYVLSFMSDIPVQAERLRTITSLWKANDTSKIQLYSLELKNKSLTFAVTAPSMFRSIIHVFSEDYVQVYSEGENLEQAFKNIAKKMNLLSRHDPAIPELPEAFFEHLTKLDK